MRPTGRKLCAVLGLLLLRAAAAQVYECDYILRDVAGGPTVYRGRMWFSRDAAQFDTEPFGGYPGRLLYDAPRGRLLLVDDERETFLEMEEHTLVRWHARLSAARRLTGNAWRRAWGEAPAERTPVLKARDEYRTMGGVRCRLVEIRQGSALRMELWGAPFGEVGLEAPDFAALAQLASRYDAVAAGARLAGYSAEMPDLYLDAARRAGLFPMMMNIYDEHGVAYQIALTRPQRSGRETLETAAPSGYRRIQPME